MGFDGGKKGIGEVAKAAAGAVLEVALETLWPTRCAVCDTPGDDVLCSECEGALKPVDACLACPRCGAPYGMLQCTECNDVSLSALGIDPEEGLPLDSMSHALLLDDAARRIVAAYKDADERRLCRFVASRLARNVSPDVCRRAFVVSYIPDTKAALRRRGFDHSREIAEALAAECGLPCMQLLDRPDSTDQRALGRRGRAANMQGRMKALANVEMPARVLLVDDVCTTGATIYSAAFALREAGVEEIRGLTFGKVLA